MEMTNSAVGTPAAEWRQAGEPDPHAGHYNCERAKLTMGHLTDDELANGAFLNYDQPLNVQGILAGTHASPIAWMTAVKDRIRWLSRALEQAKAERDALAAKLAELDGQEPEPVFWYRPCCDGEMYEGPIHNTQIERVRRLSGAWIPLYARRAPAQPVNARLLEVLRFYAEGHHFIRHDTDAWDTVSGEPQNFLEDEANTATVEDGSLAKAALSAIGEVPISFDLKTALDGVKNFFDGEYFHIDEIVDASQVCGQKQEEECQPEFDHCFVNQSGGGITGDDYHGTVFFHVGAGQYLTVRY